MCGGIGSRFWPYSRSSRPKQFIDFLGTGRTLLQMSFDRILPLVPKENVLIVTNEQYAPLVREQLPELAESQILLEPARRNTAPCIAWAAYHIAAIDPEASIIVAPSDHLITRENIFVDSVERGSASSRPTTPCLRSASAPRARKQATAIFRWGSPSTVSTASAR